MHVRLQQRNLTSMLDYSTWKDTLHHRAPDLDGLATTNRLSVPPVSTAPVRTPLEKAARVSAFAKAPADMLGPREAGAGLGFF
jgi:hypothetical protein